jgi:large subunit ribosomal protein L10
MPQQYKIDKVSDLKKYFSENKSYIFNDYKGISVEKISNLRKTLRGLDSKLVIMKNAYVRIIAKDNNLPDFKDLTTGPTAVAFAKDNANEVVKALFAFSKESSLKVKGGYAEGSLMNEKEIEAFSKLPGKKEMLAMVMATMNATTQNFVYACNDVMGRFVRVVSAVAEKKKQA